MLYVCHIHTHTRTMNLASLSRQDTVNEGSEEEEEEEQDEGVCLEHADVNDQGLDIDQQIGDDLVSFWKREIDKFDKEMTLNNCCYQTP